VHLAASKRTAFARSLYITKERTKSYANKYKLKFQKSQTRTTRTQTRYFTTLYSQFCTKRNFHENRSCIWVELFAMFWM